MWTRKSLVMKLVSCDSAQRGLALNLTRKYSARPIITTLDPERLQSSDFFDFSNFVARTIIARLRDGSRTKGKIYYYHSPGLPRFPPRTQGFLYYHRHPQLPPTTGEIRFRVTESSDPSCFHNGTDLMRFDGALPWSIPLPRLRTKHPALKELLCQDHDIPVETMDLKTNPSAGFLTYLEKPFVVTLEKSMNIRIIDSNLRIESSIARILLQIPGKSKQSLFKGKLLVRFEYASPSEHRNDISIVMRVLKVVEPIEPLVKDAALLQPVPEAGTLLKSKSLGQIRPLTFRNQTLRLLPSITGSPPPRSNITSTKGTLVEPSTRTIGTLNPHRLESSDFLLLTNVTDPKVYRRDDLRTYSVLNYACRRQSHIPFPANTHGFLYLSRKPGLPPLTAEVRFRITPSADPTQFDKGTDLSSPHGQPWNINMLQLTQKCYAYLKDQLYDDGYVDIVQALSGLPPDLPPGLHRMLYYLEQPFVVDMSQQDHRLTFLLPDKVITRRLQAVFNDYVRKTPPYTGRLVLRFERSTLPGHAKRGLAVLRVLKILDPIKAVDPDYNQRLPVPREGELLFSVRGLPRSFDFKKKTAGGLRDLPSIPDDQPDLESFR